MPVYERGYRHWEHSGRRVAPAWYAIARRGIAAPLRRRAFLLLLAVAWVPAVIKGGFIYFSDITSLLGTSWTDITPAGFLKFIEWQRYFVLIILAIVGSGLITRDREENGIALYFARPLTLVDYVCGKAAVIIFYYWSVTLMPLLALCIAGYVMSHGAGGVEMLIVTPLRAVVYCSVSGACLALALLALSSLGRRTIFVALWWVLLLSGTESLGEIMALFRPWLAGVDFLAQFINAGAPLFGAGATDGVSSGMSLVIVALWTAAAVAVLRRRIRPVEVA